MNNMNDINIRNASLNDLNRVAEIEAICFPPLEAASLESIRKRIEVFKDSFFIAESNGEIIGFINGCITNSPVIYDKMYHDISEHIPDGCNAAIFGLDVLPEYRCKGIAGKLIKYFIQKSKSDGRKTVILTCKENLIHYYEGFGFKNLGISESVHGGAQWYDMELTL